LPTTSIDTFFACTVIITAVLISTAFLTSSFQTTISGTQDINKESYLKAVADYIVTNPGVPVNWGDSELVPTDFGLAANESTIPYEVGIDKITILNQQNSYSLSYFEIATAAKLNNIALGIKVSQIMSISIQQSSNITIGNETSFSFSVLTSINSEPAKASLHCYIIGSSFLMDISNNTSNNGVGQIVFQIPNGIIENTNLVVFARASCDSRITSCAIYNFANSEQQPAPSDDVLTLSPLNYTLNLATNGPGVTVQGGYLFSFGYEQNLTYTQGVAQCPIPRIIDNSPFVIFVYGHNNATFFQDWITYPEIPLKAGSSFEGSEQNVFSYLVTIKDTLYKLDISLGDTPYK
jgi:hypothetical protein